MSRSYHSEIRDGVVRDLLHKVKTQNYGQYLAVIKLLKVRAFRFETVQFDFPVTALIGTNGGGKSTILGAAAIAYKAIRPALFFPKSSIGDDSMAQWSIGYELIEKKSNAKQLIPRSARFRNSKWVRDGLVDRDVIYFGIQRTVPAGERKEFKKFATVNYQFLGSRSMLARTTQDEVARILGKDVSKFERADISASQQFYVGGDGTITYSEFHFGAGEASVIRMVSQIEAAPENALVLIEEIENGLHPVAVRRMVEYLVDVAKRKSIQAIFTTHSDDALAPLPPEAIWSAIDGKTSQGRISIEALRAITGRIDETLAIFVEDSFAKEWVEAMIRNQIPEHIDEIGVYFIGGDSQAYTVHMSHRKNPALTGKLRSVCILDGDSKQTTDEDSGVIGLPGQMPESTVFNYVFANIDTLAMKLAVALHLPASKDAFVKGVLQKVSTTNRDPHLLFSQVGEAAGLIPANIVSSAFSALWMEDHPEDVKRVTDFVSKNIAAARNDNS